MEAPKSLILAIVLLAHICDVFPLPITSPAFLWSPQHFGPFDFDVKEVVDYRVLSPKDLAKTVLSEGSWSNILCRESNPIRNVDVALIYIGKKLQSADLSKASPNDPALLNLLKLSFTKSNTSMAFPYITISDKKATLENSLVSEFAEHCGHGLDFDHIAYMDSCSVDSENLKKLHGLRSFQDFVGSRMESGVNGKTDLIVLCDRENPVESDNALSEGETLSEIVTFLENSGAKYTVLYASDPNRGDQYPSHLALSRFLAEESVGDASPNSTRCDGLCQIKSSLFEGIIVGLVLLIILISGLCCMMGIETPTRFEAPPES